MDKAWISPPDLTEGVRIARRSGVTLARRLTFCLGRRSWLFADTVVGARASARLYSLVQCAKVNGLEPYAYLRRVFTELPRAQSLGDVEALLPTRLTPADLT